MYVVGTAVSYCFSLLVSILGIQGVHVTAARSPAITRREGRTPYVEQPLTLSVIHSKNISHSDAVSTPWPYGFTNIAT